MRHLVTAFVQVDGRQVKFAQTIDGMAPMAALDEAVHTWAEPWFPEDTAADRIGRLWGDSPDITIRVERVR